MTTTPDFRKLIDIINEAKVQPGDVKNIHFKLNKLDKLEKEIRAQQVNLSQMGTMKLPPEIQKQMDEVKNKLAEKITEIQTAKEAMEQQYNSDTRPVKMTNLFNALAKHCKEIITVYKNLNKNFESYSPGTRPRFLFRGIHADSDAVYGKPFEKRRPMTSNRGIADAVNELMTKSGFKANRENAMFTSGAYSQASSYGNKVYVMFPVDGFDFSYSRKVRDLVLGSDDFRKIIDKDAQDELIDAYENDPNLNKDIRSTFLKSDYNMKEDVDKVQQDINSGKLDKKYQKALDNFFSVDKLKEFLDFTDEDIYNAIVLHHEVNIKGDYYAVRQDFIPQLVEFLKEFDSSKVKLPESFGEVPDILDENTWVKIIEGKNSGKIGVITGEDGGKYQVYTSGNDSNYYVKQQLNKFEFPENKKPAVLKPNSVVKIIDNDSPYFGQMGIIPDYSTNPFYAPVNILGSTEYLISTQVELVDTTEAFKPGKFVILNSTYNLPSKYKGKYAEIMSDIGGDNAARLDIFDIFGKKLQEDVLETVNNFLPTDKPTFVKKLPGFEKGDKVVTTFGSDIILTIVDVNETHGNFYYTAKADQGTTINDVAEDHLKVAPDQDHKSEKIKIGDNIKILSGPKKNSFQVVSAIVEGGYAFDNNEFVAKEEDVKKVFAAKMGDYIRIPMDANLGSALKGKVGKVIWASNSSYDNDIQVSVVTDNNPNYSTYTNKYAVEPITKEEYDYETTKLGSKVEITADTENKGKVGEVINKEKSNSSSSIVVTVKFDDGSTEDYEISEVTPYEYTFKVGDIVTRSESGDKLYVVITDKDAEGDYRITGTGETHDYIYANSSQMVYTGETLKPEKISENDRVELIFGPYKGQKGKVTYVHGKNVSVNLDSNNSHDMWVGCVKKIEDKPVEYKEGDNVKIVGEPEKGQTGTIIQVDKDGDIEVQITSGPNENEKYFYEPKDLTLITDDSVAINGDFKPGDKVKIVDQDSLNVGDTGTFIEYQEKDGNPKGTVKLKLDNGSTVKTYTHWIEKVGSGSESMSGEKPSQDNVKNGQEVKIISVDDDDKSNGIKVGMVGKIVNAGHSSTFCNIKFNDPDVKPNHTGYNTLYYSQIEFVDPSEENSSESTLTPVTSSNAQIGDIVKVIKLDDMDDTNNIKIGDTVKLTKYDPPIHAGKAVWETIVVDGNWQDNDWQFYPEQLSLISEDEIPEPDDKEFDSPFDSTEESNSKFEVGQQVEVIEVDGTDKAQGIKVGMTGTVAEVDDELIHVKFDDSSVKTGSAGTNSMYDYQVKLIDPKHTEESGTDFKVGQKVEVTSVDYTDTKAGIKVGMIGTITEIDGNLFSIKFDDPSVKKNPDGTNYLSDDQVKLVTSASPTNQPVTEVTAKTAKIGQTVEVTDVVEDDIEVGISLGMIGQISELYSDTACYVDFPKIGKQLVLYTQIEYPEQPNQDSPEELKFKEGDKAVIVTGIGKGKTGIIGKYIATTDKYEFTKDDSGLKYELPPEKLEKVSDTSTEPSDTNLNPNNVAHGNKVTAITGEHAGKLGVVIAAFDTGSAIVKFDDENHDTMMKLNNLEKVNKTASSSEKLEKGDYVEILIGDYKGRTGMVLKKVGTGPYYKIVLDDGKTSQYSKNELKLTSKFKNPNSLDEDQENSELDSIISSLEQKGKQLGYLTYAMIDQALGEYADTMSREQINNLVKQLENKGITLKPF